MAGGSQWTKLEGPVVADDLVKIYKQGRVEVVALRGLTCQFHPGEVSVVMGPSGCGKTTLLNLLGGLDLPNAGKVVVNGVDVTKLPEAELERYRNAAVGFVFQFMNLIPTLTSRENVELPMLLGGVRGGGSRHSRADKLLDLVGVAHRADHKPDELSGGEQQRVAIATALANDPALVLADEPTGELDSESRDAVLGLFRALVDEFPDKAVVLVTHDPAAKRVADRVFEIADGRIVNEVSGAALKERYEEEVSGSAVVAARVAKLNSKLDRLRRVLREFQEALEGE